MVVRQCVNVKMEIVMNNLTQDKLDTILTLLTKEVNNDKDRPKPISGNDSGV